MKRVRVEELQRLMQRRPPIPVQNPDVDEGIAGIGDGAADVRSQRPGERDAQRDEQDCRAEMLPSHAARMIIRRLPSRSVWNRSGIFQSLAGLAVPLLTTAVLHSAASVAKLYWVGRFGRNAL